MTPTFTFIRVHSTSYGPGLRVVDLKNLVILLALPTWRLTATLLYASSKLIRQHCPSHVYCRSIIDGMIMNKCLSN